MSDEIATVHGVVARVIDVPSQGQSYLRIELPIEYHAEATRLFYGKRVIVALAGEAMKAQPYGLFRVSPDQEPPPGPGEESRYERHRRIAEGQPRIKATERDTPTGGTLSKSAAQVCDTPAFQRFAWFNQTGNDEAPPADYGSGDAAEFMRETCAVRSRANLDHDKRAAESFREMMAAFRQYLDVHPELAA
jgi:hypothetical protein